MVSFSTAGWSKPASQRHFHCSGNELGRGHYFSSLGGNLPSLSILGILPVQFTNAFSSDQHLPVFLEIMDLYIIILLSENSPGMVCICNINIDM